MELVLARNLALTRRPTRARTISRRHMGFRRAGHGVAWSGKPEWRRPRVIPPGRHAALVLWGRASSYRDETLLGTDHGGLPWGRMTLDHVTTAGHKTPPPSSCQADRSPDASVPV